MSKALVLGTAALALSARAASAQVPGYDYNGATVPLYGYAAPVADLAPPAYVYAPTAPLYNYAGGSTIIIVTPGSAYTAPPVASGYATQPIYDYAPGYGYEYTPGYWNRGYWGRWRAGWWR